VKSRCLRKKFFSTLQLAFNEAMRLRAITGDTDLMPYKCEFCQGWHNGHHRYQPEHTKVIKSWSKPRAIQRRRAKLRATGPGETDEDDTQTPA
jgi:hypothetical protein